MDPWNSFRTLKQKLNMLLNYIRISKHNGTTETHIQGLLNSDPMQVIINNYVWYHHNMWTYRSSSTKVSFLHSFTMLLIHYGTITIYTYTDMVSLRFLTSIHIQPAYSSAIPTNYISNDWYHWLIRIRSRELLTISMISSQRIIYWHGIVKYYCI